MVSKNSIAGRCFFCVSIWRVGIKMTIVGRVLDETSYAIFIRTPLITKPCFRK